MLTSCSLDKMRLTGAGIDRAMICTNFELGKLAFNDGCFVIAIEYLESASEEEPENWECWLLLGKAYKQSGNAAEARRVFRHLSNRSANESVAQCARDQMSSL